MHTRTHCWCPTNRSVRTPTFSVERSLENFPKPVSYYGPNDQHHPGRVRSSPRTGPPAIGTMAKCSNGGVAWSLVPNHAVTCVPCSTDRELELHSNHRRRFRVPLSSFLRVRCTELDLPLDGSSTPALALIVNSHMINLSA